MIETSKEYAEALFELARESRREEEYGSALALVRDAISADSEYMDLLSNPSIPAEERRNLLAMAFASRVPEHVLSFTQLLCERGRIREFSRCVKEYDDLYKALESVSNARVISAVPLTDDEKAALTAQLEKKSGRMVVAQYETDESIIGGVIIYMDDNVIDGSLRRRLKEVKEVIGK